MKLLVVLISVWAFIALAGCTNTMTLIHTQGQADDIVDDTSNIAPTTTVSAPITT